MRRSPPTLPLDDLPCPVLPGPNGAFKDHPPAIVVQGWCDLVERMDRRSLNRFTNRIWERNDPAGLEPLKEAISRRRRELARPLRP